MSNQSLASTDPVKAAKIAELFAATRSPKANAKVAKLHANKVADRLSGDLGTPAEARRSAIELLNATAGNPHAHNRAAGILARNPHLRERFQSALLPLPEDPAIAKEARKLGVHPDQRLDPKLANKIEASQAKATAARTQAVIGVDTTTLNGVDQLSNVGDTLARKAELNEQQLSAQQAVAVVGVGVVVEFRTGFERATERERALRDDLNLDSRVRQEIQEIDALVRDAMEETSPEIAADKAELAASRASSTSVAGSINPKEFDDAKVRVQTQAEDAVEQSQQMNTDSQSAGSADGDKGAKKSLLERIGEVTAAAAATFGAVELALRAEPAAEIAGIGLGLALAPVASAGPGAAGPGATGPGAVGP